MSGSTQAITIAPGPTPDLMPSVVEIGGAAGAIVAMFALFAQISKWVTREVARDMAEVKHKLGNHGSRIDALEHSRASEIERIVRMEVSIAGMERGLDRVERMIQTNFEALAESIREVRHVEPRRG